MRQPPTIHPVAAQHIRELRERGVVLRDAEILWIIELCHAVLHPDVRGDIIDLCAFGTRVGTSSTMLHPLTIGAAVWLQEYADHWFAGHPTRAFYALAWALANGRDNKAIQAASVGKAEASELIRGWVRTLSSTRPELEQAIDRILKTDNNSDESPRADIDWTRIICEIEGATGIPAEHWLWGASLSHTIKTWVAVKERLILQAGGKPPQLDPLQEALTNLAKAKQWIWERHLKESSECNG